MRGPVSGPGPEEAPSSTATIRPPAGLTIAPGGAAERSGLRLKNPSTLSRTQRQSTPAPMKRINRRRPPRCESLPAAWPQRRTADVPSSFVSRACVRYCRCKGPRSERRPIDSVNGTDPRWQEQPKAEHMSELKETLISKAIVDSYDRKLLRSIEGDVLIVGAGPAGLTAAAYLAAAGRKVTIVEKRLAPGGGVWGGGMGMNDIVVQEEAVPVLEAAAIRCDRRFEGLYVIDAVELACALCLRAIRAGATMLNLMTLEDVCVHDGKVTGVVVNRTMISGALPVDPIVLQAGVVIDASGHEAVAVERLRTRNLLVPRPAAAGEGPMNAAAGEAFVVERVAEAFPGLWVTGMAVSATFGGPRMGPIFGGMLLSGKRVAELILERS